MAPNYNTENYYQILGVSPHASAQEIKRSYRQRVLETHPDVGRNGRDPKRFRLVQQAYEVLSDPVERDRYDMLMGLGERADNSRFYRRSFDRLFQNLFNGLRQAMNVTPGLSDAVDEERKKAG